jgi:hypothetical protein
MSTMPEGNDSNISPGPEKKKTKKGDPPILRNLTQAHRTGLTDRHGTFLYHIVKLQVRNGWQAVSREEILASAAEDDEVAVGNDLTNKMIGQLGPELQALKWDTEEKPYLMSGRAQDGQYGYATAIEAFATIPRRAKVAVELQNWKKYRCGYEGQISQSDFVRHFNTQFGIESATIETDLKYLLLQNYLHQYDQQPVHLQPSHRLQLEMEYLRRAATIFQPGTGSVDGVLTPRETRFLGVLWQAQHIKGKRGLTAPEIAKHLGPGEPTVETLLEHLGPSGKNMLDWDESNPRVYRLYYFVLQWPPDAAMICDLIVQESFPPLKSELVRNMSRQFGQPTKRIEKDLVAFAENAGYVEPAPANPGRILATRLARAHRPFLEWIGKRLDKWKKHNREGQTWVTKNAESKGTQSSKAKRRAMSPHKRTARR